MLSSEWYGSGYVALITFFHNTILVATRTSVTSTFECPFLIQAFITSRSHIGTSKKIFLVEKNCLNEKCFICTKKVSALD